MWTWPVVISVSTATRLRGSCFSIASRIASLIWSAILSGWPSVTDSDVKRRRGTRFSLADDGAEQVDERARRRARRAERYRRAPTRRADGRTATVAGPPIGSAEARCDSRPDACGDGVLGAARHLGDGAVGAEDDDRVLRGAEDLASRDVVDDQQVAALAGELGTGMGQDVGVVVARLRREADDDLAGRPLGHQLGQHVGVAHQR